MVDSGPSLHMMGLSSLNHKEKKTIRQSNTIRDIQTANGIVVSDTEAKVYIKELGAYLGVDLMKDSSAVLSLGSLCDEHGCSYCCQEKLPDCREVRKSSNAASKTSSQRLQLPNRMLYHPLSSRDNGNFEREHTMLDLLKSFSHRLKEQDASPSTPTAGSDTTHEVVEEQSLDDKLPSVVTDAREILWKKIPSVKERYH